MKIEEKKWKAIKKLPKIDLHLHLDGSVKPGTVLDLAKTQGLILPGNTIDKIRPLLQIDENCNSLKEYLSKFDLVSRVLQTSEAIERVAFELVEQAYSTNCKYIEVRFGPQLHREKGLTVEEVIFSVIKGLKKGERKFGVGANAIACCLRHHAINQNIEVIQASAQFIDGGLAGVDLAGDEASFPAFLFRRIFKFADKKRIPITIHAGEAAGSENIKEAVQHLGATRIGHGVRLREDLHLLDYLSKNKIPLEMCPISNIQTKACSGWDDYPIREYFDLGLMVTVNTDNLTVSNTNLNKEYAMVMEKFNFTFKEIYQLVINSIDAAFISIEEKQLLKKQCKVEYDLISTGEEEVVI
ncbi:adenosine deaminase [Aquibacillus halophilus]|uniref:adenosine deaminase n=1 Tax=Aquibacillus halophilus TaxID=930132 RepID=UPI0030B8226C